MVLLFFLIVLKLCFACLVQGSKYIEFTKGCLSFNITAVSTILNIYQFIVILLLVFDSFIENTIVIIIHCSKVVLNVSSTVIIFCIFNYIFIYRR